MHRADFYLTHDGAGVGIDDQQGTGARVGCINASMRGVDRDVIEAARQRNGHGRRQRYERHIREILIEAYESNMNARQIRCCKVSVSSAGGKPNSSFGIGFDLLTAFVIGAVPNPMYP